MKNDLSGAYELNQEVAQETADIETYNEEVASEDVASSLPPGTVELEGFSNMVVKPGEQASPEAPSVPTPEKVGEQEVAPPKADTPKGESPQQTEEKKPPAPKPEEYLANIPPPKVGTRVESVGDRMDLRDKALALQASKHEFTDDSLLIDETWTEATNYLAEMYIPDEMINMSQEEINRWGLSKVREYDNDLVETISMGFDFENSTYEQKAAMFYMLEAFDKKEASWDGAKEAAWYMATDWTNLVGFGTLGVGVAAKLGVKQGAKMALKHKLAHGFILGAIEGVPFAVADDLGRQNTDLNIYRTKEYSGTQTAISGVVGGVVGGTLGTTLAGIGHKLGKFFSGTEEAMAQAAGGGSPNKHQVATAYDDSLVDMPTVGLGSLEGKTIVPIVADLTRAGDNYTGIDSSVTEPVAMMGGVNFPFLQSSQDGGLVWANQGKAISSKLAKYADEDGFVYGVVTNMKNDSHASNTSVTHATIETIKAYVRDKKLTKGNAKKIVSLVKAHGKTKNIDSLKKMPAFDDTDTALHYIDNMTFEDRKVLMDFMGSAKVKEIPGMPNMEKILKATREAEYGGGNWGDGQVIIKIDTKNVVHLGEDGTITHPSYDYGIKGEVVGKLGRPVPYERLFPDFMKSRRADENTLSKDDMRSFDMSRPGQVVTPDMIAEINTNPYTNIKSARQARMVTDAANDTWRTSEGTVKGGDGVSSVDFIDAILNSDASSTLTKYTKEEIGKAVSKKGGTKLYQLGDSQAFFSLNKGNDYTSPEGWGLDIPELTGNEKSLGSVIVNEQASPGTGGLLVAKAIQEGAEVLDAFNIKVDGKPSGILQSFYGGFGFETIKTVPFNKSFYNKQQLNDIMHTWKQQGWNPEDGYPDVVIMKYKGTDDDRANATKRLLGGSKTVSERERTKLDGAGVQQPGNNGGQSVNGDTTGGSRVNAVGGEEPGGGRKSNAAGVYDEINSLSKAELEDLRLSTPDALVLEKDERLGYLREKLSKTKNKDKKKEAEAKAKLQKQIDALEAEPKKQTSVKQQMKELNARMRDASPEEKQELIKQMQALTPKKKPKTPKAKEVIKEAEEFNSQFYSKAENEFNKLDIGDNKSPYNAMMKSGVKKDELKSLGIDEKTTVAEAKELFKNRPDKISKQSYDENHKRLNEELTAEDMRELVNIEDLHMRGRDGIRISTQDGGVSVIWKEEDGYRTIEGDVWDSREEAIEQTLNRLADVRNQNIEEGYDRFNVYEEHTVPGGKDYKLETFTMKDFDSKNLSTYTEPHLKTANLPADNIQVHVRKKVRTDSEGGDGTVVEEVQSQWEQDWRATGGDTPPTQDKVDKTIELNKQIKEEAPDIEKEIIELEKLRDSNQVDRAINRQKINDMEDSQTQDMSVYLPLKEEKDRLFKEGARLRNKVSVKEKKLADNEKLIRKNEDEIINWSPSSIASPPIRNRTQYTKMAMMDALLASRKNGEKFFGWINAHTQNGLVHRTAQGMSNAYDIEIPAIIKKETGKTPYMARFDTGEPVLKDGNNPDMLVEWNPKVLEKKPGAEDGDLKHLEFYDDIAFDNDLDGNEWYWRIDYDEPLNSKLKDAKIQMFGVGGVSLIGAASKQGEDNGNSDD